MAEQLTNYQCPSCTGPLHYDEASGKLKCDYCDSEFEISEIEALFADKNEKAEAEFEKAEDRREEKAEWDYYGLNADWGAEGENMRAYNCPSCGAELICDETTAATSCPYCGNPTIVPGQFKGSLKPDYVLPFEVSKEEAIAALKNHYKGKKLLPKTFSEENHIQEIKGVYVPFWLFDGEADADAVFEATRTHSYRTRKEEVTVTEFFDIHRAGVVKFEKIPVDAATKMPDDHMDAIEPFDYSALKPFSTAYLPGFLADKYDVPAQECAKRADERAENSAVSILKESVDGYLAVTERSRDVRLCRGQVKYALLPVWMLNTKWNGQDFLFAMNGQTGKLVGELPIDKKRYWANFVATLLGVTAAVAAVFMLLAG